jgi:glycine/D-amino acid oxidase-like deaminating enzyme
MSKKIGVIGGGIVGSSIAYFLSRYDDAEVTLFEKATIGSGTTTPSPMSSGRSGSSVSSSTRALSKTSPVRQASRRRAP